MIHRTPIRTLRAVDLWSPAYLPRRSSPWRRAYPTADPDGSVVCRRRWHRCRRAWSPPSSRKAASGRAWSSRIASAPAASPAVAHVAKSAPDGYNIGWFTGGPIVLAPITETSLPYNVAKDLIPVSQVQTTDQVLVARRA